jgi:hypothetical protein
LLDSHGGHLQRVFTYKKKCLRLSEHPEGLREEGPDVHGPQPGAAKVMLWQRIYSTDSMSLIRKMSKEGASISGKNGPESRSKMVGKLYYKTWSPT